MHPLLTTILLLFSLVAVFPLASQVKGEVWAPPITNPIGTTLWFAGNKYTVTWNATNPPPRITNPIGTIYLRHFGSANGQVTLAQGFKLTDGAACVTVPAGTATDDDYVIVLFGDAEDWSTQFSICTSESACT